MKKSDHIPHRSHLLPMRTPKPREYKLSVITRDDSISSTAFTAAVEAAMAVLNQNPDAWVAESDEDDEYGVFISG